MVPALPSSVRVRSIAASGHPARAKSGNERTIGARRPGASTTSTASETPAAGPTAISTATGSRAAGRRRPARPPPRRRARPRLLAEARRRRTDLPLHRCGASAAAGSRRGPFPATFASASGRPGSPNSEAAEPEPGPPPRSTGRPADRHRAAVPGRREPARPPTTPRAARPHRFVSRIGRRIGGRAPRPGARSRQAGNRTRPVSRPHRPEHLPRAAEPVLHPFRAIIGPCAGPIRPGLARRAGRVPAPAGAGDCPSAGNGPSGATKRTRCVSSTRRVPGHRAPPRADERVAARAAARTGVPRGRDGRVSGPASGARTGSPAPLRTPAR